MKFLCPNCNQRIAVDTIHGKCQVRCPTCAMDLLVPDRPTQASPAGTAAPSVSGAQAGPLPPKPPPTDWEITVTPRPVKTAAPLEAIAEAKYEIGDVVARGGMGAIHGATDRHIRRGVAMKVMLDPAHQSEEDTLRFVEEAQITGQLEHPGIVPIYELGVNDDKQPFYTMKFVRGRTLKEILKDLTTGLSKTVADYPLGHLLTIYQKACDAVAFAHSRRVIHRDLKPENIMIGEYGEVVVLDWGLAKVLPPSSEARRVRMKPRPGGPGRPPPRPAVVASVRADGNGAAHKTVKGAVMGTPGFMAPEQAEGDTDALDERTDLYALGAILYNILTLNPPIVSDTLDDAIARTVGGSVPHPSVYETRARGPRRRAAAEPGLGRAVPLRHCPGGSIPSSLAAVAMKALARDPDDRYPTVKALQRDIQAYQDGFATSAEAAGAWTHVRLFVKRHKAATTAAGLIAALLVASSVLNLEARLRTVRALESRDVLARQAAPEFLAKSRRMVADGQYAKALEAIDVALGLDDAAAILHLHRGQVLQDLLRFEDSIAAFRRAAALGAGGPSVEANLKLSEHLAAVARDLKDKRGISLSDYPVEIMAPLANSLEAQGRLEEATVAHGRVASGGAAVMRQRR
jgi:serine/threonine protein kinase/DNA-directed RNA polymerase subunit RPC12/RpoP